MTRHVHCVFVYLYTRTQSIQKQIVEYGILDFWSSRTWKMFSEDTVFRVELIVSSFPIQSPSKLDLTLEGASCLEEVWRSLRFNTLNGLLNVSILSRQMLMVTSFLDTAGSPVDPKSWIYHPFSEFDQPSWARNVTAEILPTGCRQINDCMPQTGKTFCPWTAIQVTFALILTCKTIHLFNGILFFTKTSSLILITR